MRKLVLLICLVFSSSFIYTGDASKIKVPKDIDARSLCPKDGGHFEHVVVVIDITTGLQQPQIDFIKSHVFSNEFYESYQPFTRFSYLLIDNTAPQSQKYVVSKCRTKTGYETNYKGDKFTSDESKLYVQGFYKKFKKSMSSSSNKIFSSTGKGSNGSLIYETIATVFSSPQLNFTDSQKKRTLIIVSDMMQNSNRLSFYKYCKKSVFNSVPNECPPFSKLFEDESLKDYIETSSPKNESAVINIIYMNHNYETLRTLDKSLISLWVDYFKHTGFRNINLIRQLDLN